MEEINNTLEQMKFFMNAEDSDIDTRQNLQFCMFGKLFSDKSPNLAALFKVMKKSWNPSRGVELQEMENGVLVFQFFCEADVRRVEQSGPWCFNGNILLLHRWEPNVPPYELTFDETTIWVQFLGLLLEWYTPQFVRKLGMNLGEVLEIDLGKDAGYSFKAAKARIKINLGNPLKPEPHSRTKLLREEGPLAMVIFRADTSSGKSRSEAGILRRTGGGLGNTPEQLEHGKSVALTKGKVHGPGLGVKPNYLIPNMASINPPGSNKTGPNSLKIAQTSKPIQIENISERPPSLRVTNIMSQEPKLLISPAPVSENRTMAFPALKGKIKDGCSSAVFSSLSKHGKRHLNENKTQKTTKLRQGKRYKPYTRKGDLQGISNNLFNDGELTDVQITEEGYTQQGEEASLKMLHQNL
ncbi:hypothetical protein FNV43_RR15202 [Rhamnella rubrinervis]|uniref:DUF4283 domain-containing protein n=1 Tax=Rhamnella rubrinervis TaxID=2594499 RepID=A0A8K0E8F4_9ROSA|nr:hypothetical protein FNV43_RR15202 [Rhamnella rubrinervis]